VRERDRERGQVEVNECKRKNGRARERKRGREEKKYITRKHAKKYSLPPV
jgi:hypothetical protein